MSDDGHVSGAVALAQPGEILLEGHVEEPVQGVFDGPVAAHGLGEALGDQEGRADVEAPRASDLSLDLDLDLDAGDAAQEPCCRQNSSPD